MRRRGVIGMMVVGMLAVSISVYAGWEDVLKGATESAGVTSAYKGMVDKAGPASSLMGDSLDLDAYVTEKTLDGLFLKVAARGESDPHQPRGAQHRSTQEGVRGGEAVVVICFDA